MDDNLLAHLLSADVEPARQVLTSGVMTGDSSVMSIMNHHHC